MSEAGELNYYRLRSAQHHFDCTPEQLDEPRRRWLEGAVSRQRALEQRLLSRPEAAALVLPAPAVEQALANLREQYGDEEEFLDDLCALGLTLAGLQTLLERQIRVEQLIEQGTPAITPATNAEARALYQQYPERFTRPPRRRVEHLLITLNGEYEENQPDRVRARMEQIRETVLVEPGAFVECIKRYSECPSVLQEGDLGWVPAGHLYPQIDRVLFDEDGGLRVGQLSPPIETEVGLHLIRCNGLDAGGPVPFETVSARICQRLDEQSRARARREWLASLA
ncbi:nitrogen fixation protein NifM [Aestuariirhabdus litorea]|uniref:peptidylprolyl isomerase n=1 Tax=Aestuariirhabdus litorea TaxID=2528527 RepID=A0A3P3VMJ5_9GAMM|nr:nitrogen fixation protein NifM [Aestuariirhabdus litorea]RRJ82949.1 nitrogen fixation protein NifM [Aestuariirhabdus litorea]RWW93108.1 nitrogen fixation protein NifM [Endozoicomonadaceae bacterium GTF-13]